MTLVLVLRILAVIGAIVVGISAVTSLLGEWNKTGLDDHVSKVMLGLLTLGCIIVILAASGAIGRA